MKKSLAILLGWAVLLTAGRLFQPDVAVADDDCSKTCIATANDCTERVKDSPNDIDRELCLKDKIDCVKKCDEEFRQQAEEKEKQKALMEQEQKATWDNQGLTPEQQQMERQKQKQIEEDQQNEKYEERRRQEQERLEQENERLNQERSNQAPQDQ